MTFDNFVDWKILATYAGAAAMTGIITQLIKNVGPLKSVPTRLISYLVAVAVLLLAEFFTDDLSVSAAVLTLFNAAVVSLATNSIYDIAGKES